MDPVILASARHRGRSRTARPLRRPCRPTPLVVAIGLATLTAASSAVAQDGALSPLIDSAFRASAPYVTPEVLRRYVSTLASDAYGGRGAGYAGERLAADYIAREFAAIGLAPAGQGHEGQARYLQPFQFVPPLPVHPGDVLESENVLAVVPGTDARLGRQIVVIGAHHDGQGRIGEADPGREMPKGPGPLRDSIWNSADDNASSVAVVLAIARALRTSGVQVRRTVVFATFGGEEPGMQGSLYYVAHPPLPWTQHVAMFTMEQMGRHADMEPIAMDAGTSPSWPALFHRANVASGIHLTILSPEVIQDSDHYGFAVLGLPAVVFGVNHDDDIHLPSDEWEKFDFPAFTKRAQFALALLLELADMPVAPARAARPACHNGTRIENLDARCSSAYDPGLELAHLTDAERHAAGLGAGEGGLKVIVTVAGLAADRAGIAPGDILVAVDGRPLARDASLRVLHHAADAAATHAVDVVVIRQTAHLHVTIGPVRREPVPQ